MMVTDPNAQRRTVRRIRDDEWREVRDLRLLALADPAASLAFIGSVDQAAREPDEFWKNRTAQGAGGDETAQFIVEVDGVWVGTATALVQQAGSRAVTGVLRLVPRVIIVGVFIVDEERGRGTVEDLLAACGDWARTNGFTEIHLDVHVDNARAISAYERYGFRDSQVRFTSVLGAEQEMHRSL